uniref:Uncharacterized protein n=1 Tax=Siphoviridae sp. ctM4P7 TaxID=2826256 RepID=A0A8S5MY93_9CAUD|nr:MAG TPA: hypothetical protein [Siphoviridae sp. ctM4P7]
MCRHEMIKVNDIKVCKKCGLTVLKDGRLFFDKQFVRQMQRKKVKKNA